VKHKVTTLPVMGLSRQHLSQRARR